MVKLVSDCHTKAHTPCPKYAEVIPTAPDMIAAENDTFAWVRKSSLITNWVRLTMASDEIKSEIENTRVIGVSCGKL